MTVGNLIEQLKTCDPNALILLIGDIADDGRAEGLTPTVAVQGEAQWGWGWTGHKCYLVGLPEPPPDSVPVVWLE